MKPNPTTNIQDQGRRDFFIKIALASLATTVPPFLLSSCKEKIKYLGTGKVPFKVWEEMLQAIKTSPDFLPQRVEDLIANKDPKAMYDFVKNEIILIPTTKNAISYNDLGNGTKWGIEGVLRCGMATPREKVELLNQMYQKSGIESKVVYESTAIKADDVPAFFYRPFQREFKPKISKSQYKKWQNEMSGVDELDNDKKIVVDYTQEAKILSDKIIKTLPNIDDFGSKFNFKWDNYNTPTLEFTHNEKTQYAHLFDPKTPFGEKHNSSNGKIKKAKPVKENKEKISLKITYRDTVNYKKEKELINGEWNAIDLIGKQINLQFLHGLSFEEQMVTPIGNLRTFTPVLALQAIDKDLDFIEKRSFIADPITIDGKRIPISKGKNITLNGNEIITKSHPELQKQVQKLEVSAKASGYPIVKLNVNAIDAKGELIEGLSAKDFKITDNDKPVRALLENNQRTPKILVLSDNSMSMPSTYRNEKMQAFNTSLKTKIKEKYPSAILDFWKTPSSLFTWLLKASQTSFDLIIYATDGDNDDSFEEKNRSIYQSGAPAIILNVYNSEKGHRLDAFTKMAEITNGIVLDAKDQDKTLVEVTNYIEKMELSPYVFTYASADKSKPHTVKVTLDNERLSAKGNYTFPKTKLNNKNGIVGMYLELKIGKNKPIKRVLAGWDPIVDSTIEPTSKEVDAVHQLLLGDVMLAIEGEGPTLSMALSDLLKSKLSNRKWGEAYLNNDIKKAKEELSKGSINIPPILISMLAPLQNQVTKESITYPTGYRMCLLKTLKPIHQDGSFTFDYLPTSNYQTMAKDKRTRFIVNSNKTAELAIREGVLFQQSTFSEIGNSKLIERSIALKSNWLKKNIEYGKRDYTYWNEKVFRGEYDYTKVFDQLASSKSFWKINSWSGELYGIMPDGSGGGGDSIKEELDNLSLVIDGYLLLLGVAGFAGPSLSVVATLKKTEVKLMAIACETIIIMDTSGINDEIVKILQQLACNVFKDIVFGFGGPTGTAFSSFEYFIGLMGGKSPFSC